MYCEGSSMTVIKTGNVKRKFSISYGLHTVFYIVPKQLGRCTGGWLSCFVHPWISRIFLSAGIGEHVIAVVPRTVRLAMVLLYIITLFYVLTGVNAAESGPRDDDCYQWCCSFWKTAVASWDFAFSECEASTSFRPESAKRYGEWLVAVPLFLECWVEHIQVTV